MARVLPKTHPFEATDVVAAWQAFAWEDPEDGRPYTIATTLKLRVDHPAVVAQPWGFFAVVTSSPEGEENHRAPARCSEALSTTG